MTPGLVSVCIPTYNGERYLRQCLESVCNQTRDALEILLVDDASTDGTVAVAQSYAVHDKRLRIVRNERNLGLVQNWNRCVQLATGPWLKFLFQDDVLDTHCLERMLAGPVRPMVVCQRDFVFEDVPQAVVDRYAKVARTYSLEAAFGSTTDVPPAQFCAAVTRYMTANFIGEPTGVLLHRTVFERYGTFDASLIQLCDLEFWLRVGVSVGMTHVPETLAHFRVHGTSTTASNQSNKAFAKDVIDELSLQYAFATGAHYEPLRRHAQAGGLDLMAYYRERLLFEQMWGEHWHCQDWSAFIKRHPHLKLPLAHRLRRQAKRAARMVRVGFRGPAP